VSLVSIGFDKIDGHFDERGVCFFAFFNPFNLFANQGNHTQNEPVFNH
jgi:hypothetical protein